MNSSSDSHEVDVCFSTLLSDTIEETLGDLLGERAKQAIYACLERQGLRKHQISEYLPRFDAFLEDNFGISGRLVERHIAKRLYTQLGLELGEVSHYGLTDYVDMASRRLSRVERLSD